MTKKHIYQVLIIGLATFSMFFGAGNLIFPPSLGQSSGANFLESMFGFLLTGVGLPLLGLIAVAKMRGGIEKMGKRVHPLFGNILAMTVVLIIGPLFAIPRTCATTYELGILPSFPWINSWLFSIVYFGINLYLVINPSSAVDRIGKYMTPVLLGTLAILIIAGIANPIGLVGSEYVSHSFGKGFLEGFQTMDLIGSTVMGMVILNQVVRKGITDKKGQFNWVLWTAIIAAICLALVYSGLLYLGATSGALANGLSRVDLLSFITNNLLGSYGRLALAIAVSFACLTTSVALIVLNGEYFAKMSNNKLSYKWICVACTTLSLVISNAGVETIIKLAFPPLIAVYPVIIVLVVMAFFDNMIKNPNVFRGAVVGAFVIGVFKAAKNLGFEHDGLNSLYQTIPLVDLEMGWAVTAVIGGLIGAFIKTKKVLMIEINEQKQMDY